MAQILSLLLSELLFSLAVILSSGYGMSIIGKEPKSVCTGFEHSYCSSKFNYTTAIFPNPRGHETPEEAATEFSDFNTLLLNGGCHPKLGMLLCFIYFPVCNTTNFNPNTALVDATFYPCSEACTEVHNSECTQLVTSSPAGGWAPHLQCNFTDKATGRRYYKQAQRFSSAFPPTNCIDRAVTETTRGDNECATGAHNCHVNAQCTDTEAGFNCSCKMGFTGDGYNCSDVDECSTSSHECSDNAQCTNTEGSYTCTCNAGYTGNGVNCTAMSLCTEGVCESCKSRITATSRTFKSNCYCYAARVTVVSSYVRDCNHVHMVTVEEQFDLKTPYNATHNTLAPALTRNEQIEVLINPSHCENCSLLTINKEYIIAGSYSKTEDGSVTWHLEGSNNKALASVWIDKYTKKMKKWIEDGNNDRLTNIKCTRQCE